MASETAKQLHQNDDHIEALHAIINQNLTTGIYDADDLNDDHIDMNSNVSSGHWQRGSVSYSQPSSPKFNASFSPTTSVSSLSELSNETYEGDSESCASLNSVNSADSILHDILHESVQTVIHENKENTHHLPINKQNKLNNIKSNKKHKISKSMAFEQFVLKTKKTSKTVSHKNRNRRNSKDCLDITSLARLMTKPIELWSIADVVQWVKLIDGGKYKEYASNFKSKKIDGKKLYKINRAVLQSIEIYHPSARKAILAALQRLKIKMRQKARKQINIYAKTHQYDKKMKIKESKQHWRNMSSSSSYGGQIYLIAIKKQKKKKLCMNESKNDIIPSLILPKQRGDISEFLGKWHIKQSRSSNINFIGSVILEQTKNFTMIELSNKRIVYAMTNKVAKWNNNDVCKWLNSVSGSCFKPFIPKFKERNTNGFDLLNISRVQLQNNIGMKDIEMRNRLLHEIKLLKIATTSKTKKRRSAVLTKKASNHGHRRAISMLDLNGALEKSFSHNDMERKLGPRDIGRIKYKGTKYKKSMFDYDFLEEKLSFHSKSAQFNKRKQKNPVQHKETVDEIGICQDYQKPEYCNDVLRNMNGGEWLKDRPISRRNVILDKLKGTKIPKAQKISDIHQPIGWQPIQYNYRNDGKGFLEEHFWYDGSAVQFEFGFSRLLSCLAPTKQMKLNKQPSPTGYESKLNWLKMLLKLVTQEMDIVKKEDALYQMTDIVKKEDDNVSIEVMSVDNEESESKIESMNETESVSNTESDSNDEVLSPLDIQSPNSATKREMYKRDRRTHTTLANSTLNRVNPAKRRLSRHDMNRRRFMSQESVDSIQAIISNIEKKRGNVNE